MDPILSILAQALMTGLVLACIYIAGALILKSREHTFANFISKKMASGVWLFISGFVGDLVVYLTLVWS